MSNVCTVCEMGCSDSAGDRIMCFGQCGLSFHIKCVNISSKQLSVLNAIDNAKWFCNGCLEPYAKGVKMAINDNIVAEVKKTMDPMKSAASLLQQLLPVLSDIVNANEQHDIVKTVQNGVSNGSSIFGKKDFPPIGPTPKRNREQVEPNSASKKKVSNLYRDKLVFGKGQATNKITGVARRDPKFNDNARDNNKCIFVSRLATNTTCENIVAHLLESKVITAETDVKCIRLVPASKNVAELSFVSFKVIAAKELFDAIADPSIWPAEIAVREFIDNPPRPIAVGYLHNSSKKKHCAEANDSTPITPVMRNPIVYMRNEKRNIETVEHIDLTEPTSSKTPFTQTSIAAGLDMMRAAAQAEPDPFQAGKN